jgi:hypothetical protein
MIQSKHQAEKRAMNASLPPPSATMMIRPVTAQGRADDSEIIYSQNG